MKKIFTIALFLALHLASFAGDKDFEGNITFGINLEGTGTDILKAMLPSNYVYVLKQNQMLFRMEGGMVGGMIGEVVINANDGQHYMVKHKDKTAYKIDAESMNEEDSPSNNAEITPLDEYQTILGYKCQKYKIVTEQNGEKSEQYIWATPDITVAGQGEIDSELSGNIFYKGVQGFPLKVEALISKMGMDFKMIMTATSVNPETIDKAVFTIPQSYQVKDFEPSSMMGF